MKITLLILVFSSLGIAQNTFSGKVLDKDTNQIIPYANLNILKSALGTSSQEDGSFFLNYNNDDLTKDVLISNLGYRDTIIPLSRFKEINTLFLKKENTLLSEVVLKTLKFQNTHQINNYDNLELNNLFACQTKPYKLALFFPYEENYKKTPFLKSIKVFVQKTKVNGVKFRVRILSNSVANYPLSDILDSDLIVILEKKQKVAEIDVSKFKIEIPKNGLHIALEWLDLPLNKLDIKYRYKTLDKKKKKFKGVKLYPDFILVKDNTLVTSWFTNDHWFQFPVPSIYEIRKLSAPAISLLLTD